MSCPQIPHTAYYVLSHQLRQGWHWQWKKSSLVISISPTHTHTYWLSLAGAAVVAPFAHMFADVCTHTHSQKPSRSSTMRKGSELWRSRDSRTDACIHTHTHIERLSSHWSASLHPTAGVSEGSAAVLCSRGLETLEWAIFSPLLLFLG